MKHATVQVGAYNIPLIGVPLTATEEKCDECSSIEQIATIELYGTRFLCPKHAQIERELEKQWNERLQL